MKYLLIVYMALVLCLASCQRNSQSPMYHSPAAIAARIYAINEKVPLSPKTQAELALLFIRNDSLANIALQRGDSLAIIISEYYDLNFDTITALLTPEERSNYLLAFSQKNKNYVSNLRNVIRYKATLTLSRQQVEQLLSASEEIEKFHGTKEYHYEDVEKEFMRNILSEQQQRRFYIERNVASVKQWTSEQMEKCKKTGCFSFPQDSTRLYSLFYDYELNRRGMLDYISNIAPKEYQKEQDRINAYKPIELLKLDVYSKSFFHSKLLDIICKRQEGGISEGQIKVLLEGYAKIKQDEYASKYENKTDGFKKFDSRKLESECLIKNLSSLQLDKYFKYISREGAEKRAKKHWEDMKQCDFAQKLDSVHTLKELEHYEMRLAIADQWVNLDRSRKNLFAKEDILCDKPKCLMLKDEWIKKKKEESIVKF